MSEDAERHLSGFSKKGKRKKNVNCTNYEDLFTTFFKKTMVWVTEYYDY